MAKAEVEIGPRSASYTSNALRRADIALEAGAQELDVAIAVLEQNLCSDPSAPCLDFEVARYAARIGVIDPARAEAVIAKLAPRVSEASKRTLNWILTFVRAARAARGEDLRLLYEGIQAEGRRSADRIGSAFELSEAGLEAAIRVRDDEILSLEGALTAVRQARDEWRDDPEDGTGRRKLVDAFLVELRALVSRFEAEQGIDEARLRSLRRTAAKPPVVFAPPPSAPGVSPGPSAQPTLAPTRSTSTFTEVNVHYATSRGRAGTLASAKDYREAERFYGGVSARRIEYGIATVAVPKARRPDDHLPLPGVLTGDLDLSTFELVYSPSRHVTVQRILPVQQTAFFNDLRTAGQGPAILFVHGFNMSFTDAARRTGQLKVDLAVTGPAMMYSWPAQGGIFNYDVDGNTVEGELRDERFLKFLNEVRASLGSRRVVIIAHSMGARLVAAALTRLAASRPAASERLPSVVFAAADMDTSKFEAAATGWRAAADRITLYASSWDKALWASTVRNLGPRAGLAQKIAVAQTVESIDASSAEGEFIHHSYFGEGLLTDLNGLLRLGLRPSQRCVLSATLRGQLRVWSLSERQCRLPAFKAAIGLVIRAGAGGAAEALRLVREQLQKPGGYTQNLRRVEEALRPIAAQPS